MKPETEKFEEPWIVVILMVLACLNVVGGIVAAFNGLGLIGISAGFGSGLMCWIFSEIIAALHRIDLNTRPRSPLPSQAAVPVKASPVKETKSEPYRI